MSRCLRCACGRPAVTVIRADLLGGVAMVAIGACKRHDPKSDADAYVMISALLKGIARAGSSRRGVHAHRGGGR